MRILLDTNVLVRVADPKDPDQGLAADALDRLDQQGHELRLVPQNLYELWVVGTRPKATNGLGFSSQEMQVLLQRFAELFPLLKDERGVIDRWQALVIQQDVRGKQAHDARIVAAMLRHGVDHLLTFNAADFGRYSEIAVLSPGDVVSA